MPTIPTLALIGALCLSQFASGQAIDGAAADGQSLESLGQMSIEELGNVEITSVSKRPEPLADAPAAVYVLDHDQIVRSGAESIPEMLRLAPNLQVAQINPAAYAITARGLSGSFAAQNFSNKILVLIDGRSVYTPLYSGVYWDMQDLLPDDVDRIEVISGPGATLWGANAVNGVINITTRSASATQGGVFEIGGGNERLSTALRYGGRLSDELSYRLYAKAFRMSEYGSTTGDGARDGWSKPQGGFRLDWQPGSDRFTLQGDLYSGAEKQGTNSDSLISGGNLQFHWTRGFEDGSSLQLLAYYDQTRRSQNDGGGSFTLRTYDLELEHSFALGDSNKIVWGVGQRVNAYRTAGAFDAFSAFEFVPAERTMILANLFIEDSIRLARALELTVGLKLERDPYSEFTPMPSVRLSWKPTTDTLIWAAASRAVRAPTPYDVDLVESSLGTPFIMGNPNFKPEDLQAFELGYRQQITPALSLSVSTFAHVYDDLRNVVSDQQVYRWGNGIEGQIYGVEAWASWQIRPWWRLNAGLTLQRRSLRFKTEADALAGLSQVGDDPREHATLRSSFNIGRAMTFDADLRYVGALPDPKVADYAELDLRLGWKVTDRVELSISGLNLLHDKHLEYTDPPSDLIRRSFFVDTRWKF